MLAFLRCLPAASAVLLASATTNQAGDHAAGLATIQAADIRADLGVLASPHREGRDTPSQGLKEAARYIAERFRAAGLVCAPDAAAVSKEFGGASPAGDATATGPSTADASGCTYLRPFLLEEWPSPDRMRTTLRLEVEGQPPLDYRYGEDFVPINGASGEAQGDLVFAGYGIQSKSEHWDELGPAKLRGKIALVLEGEPFHAKRFGGREISPAASFCDKLDNLREAGAAGVLFVRQPPTGLDAPAPAPDAYDISSVDFRSTRAFFLGRDSEAEFPATAPPALEISRACANALLGPDVAELAAQIEKGMQPVRIKSAGRRVAFASHVGDGKVPVDNVIGLVPGSDLAGEWVVLGAHYDHIGVDRRGRIGFGADDNATGVTALIEVAQAFAAARPRRTLCAIAFAGEEDGMLGSKAFCDRLPVAPEKIVAMINLDQIGRGDADAVAVLGLLQNPTLEKVLGRAKKLAKSGISTVVTRKGEDLFERSDHYSFHLIHIPVLFFFEGVPLSKNPDYHTWRDTLERVDFDKVLHTTRFVYNTAWLLANDDEKPPRP